MLLGLSVFLASLPGGSGAWDGVGAMLFYLLVYALATLGAFAALACLGKDDVQIDAVDELAGLAWTPGLLRRLLAWTLAVCLFSLAGIPPLAGFWGKLAVFFSALSLGDIAAPARPWMIALAVIGVVNAVIGAAYYLRVVAAMFFRIPLGTLPVKRAAGGTLIAAVLSAALVVGIGVLPGPWLRTATLASPGRGTVEHESVGRETVERESVGRQTVERESVKRETDAPIHGPRTHGLTAHGRSG